MAKKAASTRQTTHVKGQIPQMPDGYYSSGPNPNLRRFIEEHAKPYDPSTDRYKVKPFDQPITTKKATDIYYMHTYWSKKPHDAISQYIQHYTKPGDLVIDPFCGSGGTALAALMEGRSAIAIDLSPAATFITKNYCTSVDPMVLDQGVEDLIQNVKPKIDWLYETRCDRCDGKATIAYTVYSQTYQCPRCLEKVPLYDCLEFAGDNKNLKKISVCPYCFERGHKERISTQSKKYGSVPVMVVYDCQEGCKPIRGERYYRDKNPKKQEYFFTYDVKKIDEIKGMKLPFPTPLNDLRGVGTRYKKDGLHLLGLETVSDLYTYRNLYALALLRESIAVDSPLAAVLTSTSLSASKLYRHRSSGGGGPKGTDYYIAPINREMNVWELFRKRYKNIKVCYPLPLATTEVLISTQSAVDLGSIISNSIDYIFTDPPYSGTIQYGELNYVWECWLGFDTRWKEQEITVNEYLGKTEDDWADLIGKAMSECFRVLKPGRTLSLCYHDTSEGTWQLVQDIMAETGFIAENSKTPLYIDTGGGTYNQSTAEKTTKRDLVINFRKPRPGELNGQMELFVDGDFANFHDIGRFILTETLSKHPGTTADKLYDELVSRTVRKGLFERHDFDSLLRSVAEESPTGSGRWYSLVSSGQLDEAESNKENLAAEKLEDFMKKYLKENRADTGVHYSDLFEQYLPIQDKPRRLLQEWLPEFFYKTADGTWRPPQTDEERQQKAALRSSGSLRRIKRFSNALIEGVPPYEKDRPENPATLKDWIRQCRRSGLYEYGRILYEKGGLRFEGLDEEAQIEVEEDYQVCVRRAEKKEDVTKRIDKKTSQLSLSLEVEEE